MIARNYSRVDLGPPPRRLPQPRHRDLEQSTYSSSRNAKQLMCTEDDIKPEDAQRQSRFRRSWVTGFDSWNVINPGNNLTLIERKNHVPILLHVDHGPSVNGSGFGKSLHVSLQHGLERLRILPFRMRGASAFTRSSAKANWTYIGCSTQRVPSLSKVAMRSAGATKSAPPALVTRSTKSTMACFVGVSFHDGKGS